MPGGHRAPRRDVNPNRVARAMGVDPILDPTGRRARRRNQFNPIPNPVPPQPSRRYQLDNTLPPIIDPWRFREPVPGPEQRAVMPNVPVFNEALPVAEPVIHRLCVKANPVQDREPVAASHISRPVEDRGRYASPASHNVQVGPAQRPRPLERSREEIPQEERRQEEQNPVSPSTAGVHARPVPVVQDDPPRPREREKAIAKLFAEAIIQGLQSEIEAPEAEYWRTLDRSWTPLQMANALWAQSRCVDDPRPVCWVNRFYASCMRNILRHSEFDPQNYDPENWHKQRSAAVSEIINMVADEFGDRVYVGLAIQDINLSKLYFVSQERYIVVARLIAAGYRPICSILKMHKTSRRAAPLDGPFNGPRGLPICDEIVYPNMTEQLKEKLSDARLVDTSKRRRWHRDGEADLPRRAEPTVYSISLWGHNLTHLCEEIMGELGRDVRHSFKERLQCRANLMLIERGGLQCDTTACVNLIVPIRMLRPDGVECDPLVNYNTGSGNRLLRDWLAKPVVSLRGSAIVKTTTEPLAFFWVRYYFERDHLQAA
ncbi:hypothetical protein F4808DRAFT_474567 [Astrocystis sublimbata]|nr:hypothetical protein F4808DRAFT_474567 [Astrocystis sublimbata]